MVIKENGENFPPAIKQNPIVFHGSARVVCKKTLSKQEKGDLQVAFKNCCAQKKLLASMRIQDNIISIDASSDVDVWIILQWMEIDKTPSPKTTKKNKSLPPKMYRPTGRQYRLSHRYG
ncbi:MAG TPA: hypothetical protein VJH89_03595 [Patescibacteria group bacterium]|nr:hypothetical protein [Patescibacteria group bacterium]